MNRFRDPKRVVAFAIALATLQGCVSSTTSVSNSDIVVESGIVFATIDGVSLELDLARPARGRRPKPALVYLFGGGWISGTRGQFTDEIEEAARRGYVAISVDYRLTDVEVNGVPRYQFPTQVHDAKRAVRWLRDNAPMYSIDPDRIGAIGWSAGGHLALMLALTDATDGLEGESDVNAPSSRIQAAVALAGPTELAECYREYSGYLSKDTFFPRFLGGTPNQLPEQYLAASPTTYATSDDPPVLCIIGDHDTSVTERQGRLLQQRMQSVGASCEVVVVEGLMHGHLVVPAPPWEENIWRFFETNLSGR